jgi:hypothetical protein
VTTIFNAISKSWRLYSSTVSQQPASLAKALYPYREDFELLLPDPVKSIETTPIITTSELDKYFCPLFCRGWDIKRLPEAKVNSNSDPVRNIWLNNWTLIEYLLCRIQNHASSFLVQKFRFKGNRSARAFLQEIMKIENEEKVRFQLANHAILTTGHWTP